MSAPFLRPLLTLAAVIAVVACSPTQPTSSSEPSSPDVADLACASFDLRDPTGQPLQLTGAWRGNDFGEYFLSQRGSCLYWMGRSNVPETFAPGTAWSNVLVGQVHADFTIEGPWGDVPLSGEAPPLNGGQMILRIDFFDQGFATYPSLRMLEEHSLRGFGGHDWVPEDSLGSREPYTGVYGFTKPDCPWIDVDGTRYEIAEWQYSLASGGQLLLGGEQLVAGPGDPITVDGQISQALGRVGCQPGSMLAWDLQASP